MQFKYVNMSKTGIIIWPMTHHVFHSDIAKGAQQEISGNGVVSAGFADIHNGVVTCHGKSESLNKASMPLNDAALIAHMFDLKSSFELKPAIDDVRR